MNRSAGKQMKSSQKNIKKRQEIKKDSFGIMSYFWSAWNVIASSVVSLFKKREDDAPANSSLIRYQSPDGNGVVRGNFAWVFVPSNSLGQSSNLEDVTGNWGWAFVPDTSPIQSPNDYQASFYHHGHYNNPAAWNNYDTSVAPLVMIDQQTNLTGYGQSCTQQTISPSADLISFEDPPQLLPEIFQQVNNYDAPLLHYDQQIVEVAKQLWQSSIESSDNTALAHTYFQDHDDIPNNEINKQENNVGFYNPASYTSEWNQSGTLSYDINQPSSVFDYGQPSIFNPSNDVSAISTNTLESNQYHPEYNNWYVPR